MANQIILKFTGSLAPNDKITARTLSHSLQGLQRAVDKIVIFETRQSLRKFDSLSSRQYIEADFIVNQFEPGCIQIPLVNEAAEYIATRLRGALNEPYNLAASQQEQLFLPIGQQLPAAYNRALHANPLVNIQERLIENANVERAYSTVAILNEIDHILSPMRSKRTGEDDAISLRITDDAITKDYVFTKAISKRFHSVVTSQKLGPETVYRGHLRGLEASNSKDFPYSGKFISSTTEFEMKLLISTEEAALALSPYNLSPDELMFWAAPMTTYGAFDEVRGNIVFLEFLV